MFHLPDSRGKVRLDRMSCQAFTIYDCRLTILTTKKQSYKTGITLFLRCFVV